MAKLAGKVKYDPDRSYRLCDHCVTLETEEGTLLYQTLTAELLLLDEREACLLSSLPGSIPEELTELLSKHFIVSADFDEKLFCDQLRETLTNSPSASAGQFAL